MRITMRSISISAALFCAFPYYSFADDAATAAQDVALDDLPDAVRSTMEVRDRWFSATSSPTPGESFVVDDVQRWMPGQTLRVAFLGGTTALHKDIADATKEISEACNIKLDFGLDPATGNYRTWSPADNDTTHKAEIRVSFDQDGYFSLVGTDSTSSFIGAPGGPVGGRPNQRSLNLEGFHIQRPAGWKGTTRHEFLHALAFHHEHQSPSGGCDNEFRWQDDTGYQPTQDTFGRYINDANGLRPGIYTYLAGYANFWNKVKVDHNLRQISPVGLTSGTFDQKSVMLYRFPSLFYRTSPSPCAPLGNGDQLSDGDKGGLAHLYPAEAPAANVITERRNKAVRSLLNSKSLGPKIKDTISSQFKDIK